MAMETNLCGEGETLPPNQYSPTTIDRSCRNAPHRSARIPGEERLCNNGEKDPPGSAQKREDLSMDNRLIPELQMQLAEDSYVDSLI
eukprot:c23490_g2_i1 orf=276-536(+)